MGNISFRGRKNGKCFDAGFFLHATKHTHADLSSWQVGDHVGVCFEDQAELIRQVGEHCPSGFAFHPAQGSFLQVRCVVVERHRGIIWKAVGRFDELLPCRIVLEAEDGYWEDVLRWVVLGQRPEWVPLDRTGDGA